MGAGSFLGRSVDGEVAVDNAALLREYGAAQVAAACDQQERDTLRRLTRELHAEFAASAARCESLVAGWRAVLTQHDTPTAAEAAACVGFAAQVQTENDRMASLLAARQLVRERSRRLRVGAGRSRSHLRSVRRKVDDALFVAPEPPALPSTLDEIEDVTYFFHDMRHNLQIVAAAAAELRRALPPASIARYHTLERGLIGLTEDLEALHPSPLPPPRPALMLVPPLVVEARSGTMQNG